ncbi:MAG: hypothetical protein HY934_09770, partial [Candidatus Firestonebacteria bacterium]|nr:hypothetical protein [Candidatus Firestonebacteria bacterium]
MDKYEIEYLNKEEKELMEDINNIDVKTLKQPSKKEQKLFRKAARNFIANETKMNIRLDPYELNKIKERANHEGLTYSA